MAHDSSWFTYCLSFQNNGSEVTVRELVFAKQPQSILNQQICSENVYWRVCISNYRCQKPRENVRYVRNVETELILPSAQIFLEILVGDL